MNELLRECHHDLEFRIVHLLEPAPQTQTATAHLQTTWTVYFHGQGTQILAFGTHPPSSRAPPPLPPPNPGRGGGVEGG